MSILLKIWHKMSTELILYIINSQPNLSIDLEHVHPSVDIETYYDGNETYLNSEDIERNMTYLLSNTDSESSDSSDECRENLHESLREWAIKKQYTKYFTRRFAQNFKTVASRSAKRSSNTFMYRN